MIKRIKFSLRKNASLSPNSRRASCSSIIAALISAISFKTLAELISLRRKYARFSRAFSCRPTEVSHLGDSYSEDESTKPMWVQNLTLTVKSPKVRIPAGTSWNPKGILHMLALAVIWISTPTADILS